jgi:hypothetical protein
LSVCPFGHCARLRGWREGDAARAFSGVAAAFLTRWAKAMTAGARERQAIARRKCEHAWRCTEGTPEDECCGRYLPSLFGQ